MNSKYTAEVHFSKYSYHNVITTQKMMMLLGNISTVQFLHCKALFTQHVTKTWMENQSIGGLQPKVIFHVTSIYISTFNERLFSQSHHSEKNRQPATYSSQPKGKVLFWLLVAEKGVKTPIQSYTLDYRTNPSTDSYSI